MKILVVNDSLPYPLTYGAAVRVYNFIKYLSKSNEVSLIAFKSEDDSEDSIAHVRSFCKTVTLVDHHISNKTKRLRQLRAALSTASSLYYEYTCPNFQRKLDELLKTQSFDCIQLEFSFMGHYELNSTAFSCLDEHNVEFNIHYRFYQQETNPAKKLYRYLEYQKVKTEEIRQAKTFDHVFYPSKIDAETMRQYLSQSVSVVPNGVDIDYFRPSENGTSGPFLYFGAMNYGPNIDGVQYFAQEIWPLIRQKRPSAVFEIVGPNPPDQIKKLHGKSGIHVTGEVKDIRDPLHRAAVIVVPLRIGSGTRLKILEAMAMGKAIVSTSIGCEGIEVANREHLSVADSPSEFAERCLELDSDPDLRRSLGKSGRQLVEENYSWGAICHSVQRIYEQAH